MGRRISTRSTAAAWLLDASSIAAKRANEVATSHNTPVGGYLFLDQVGKSGGNTLQMINERPWKAGGAHLFFVPRESGTAPRVALILELSSGPVGKQNNVGLGEQGDVTMRDARSSMGREINHHGQSCI